MSKNQQAREFGVQFLYHLQLPVFRNQIAEIDSSDLFHRIVEFKQTIGVDLDGQNEAYLTSLIKGILQHFDDLEEVIKRHLKNWKL